MVAAVQASEALKLLTGRATDLHGSLVQFDVWRNERRRITLGERDPNCETCGRGIYSSLSAEAGERAATLCGRDAVQVTPARPTRLDLAALAERLRASGEVQLNPYLLRFHAGPYELTVFQDARMIVRGTDDLMMARSLYAKYVGT
jgi:adenylyltransferase/sulfurtransferase